MTLQEIIDEIPNLSKNEMIQMHDLVEEYLLLHEADSRPDRLGSEAIKEENLLENKS